jgi:hypothetical protein
MGWGQQEQEGGRLGGQQGFCRNLSRTGGTEAEFPQVQLVTKAAPAAATGPKQERLSLVEVVAACYLQQLLQQASNQQPQHPPAKTQTHAIMAAGDQGLQWEAKMRGRKGDKLVAASLHVGTARSSPAPGFHTFLAAVWRCSQQGTQQVASALCTA